MSQKIVKGYPETNMTKVIGNGDCLAHAFAIAASLWLKKGADKPTRQDGLATNPEIALAETKATKAMRDRLVKAACDSTAYSRRNLAAQASSQARLNHKKGSMKRMPSTRVPPRAEREDLMTLT